MKVPTLSDMGWINDPVLKLNTIYNYFQASEEAQTFNYDGKISSLKYLLAKYGTEEEELSLQVTGLLKGMLSRYFYSAEVTTWITYPDGDDGKVFVINLDMEVFEKDNPNSFKLSRTIINRDHILENLEKINLIGS